MAYATHMRLYVRMDMYARTHERTNARARMWSHAHNQRNPHKEGAGQPTEAEYVQHITVVSNTVLRDRMRGGGGRNSLDCYIYIAKLATLEYVLYLMAVVLPPIKRILHHAMTN